LRSPRYSRPKTRRDWKSILRIAIIPALALTCVIGLFVAEHHFQRDKRTTWTTVPAMIEATRIQPIPGRPFEYGSKQLYEVDVLVTYPLNGTPQHLWLPLSQPPQRRAAAQTQQAILEGAPCFLRWDPAHPDDKIAELR
jgi:hypothetical protein